MRQVSRTLVSWFLIFQSLALLPSLSAHASPNVENVPNSGAGRLGPTVGGVQTATSIQFTIDPVSHFLIIPVQINGQEPLPFMVDTGVDQPVIIEKWAAEKLRIVPTENTKAISPGNQKFPLVSLRSLLIRSTTPATDSKYTDVPASIGDVNLSDYGAPQIAGVLGLPLFFKLVMQLDFSQHVMYLYLPGRMDRTQLEPNAAFLKLIQPDETEARYSVSWPVQLSNDVTTSKDDGGYEHTVTSTSTDTYNLWLDTGADVSCLPGTVISSLHPVGMTAAQTLTQGGLLKSTLAFIPYLRVADYVVPNLLVTRSNPESEVIAANTLGIDILRHFRVTFDFPNKELILDKFVQDSSTGIPGTTGIRLEKRGTDFFVYRILNHSPSEKTSVHVGDQIIQIDGQTLSGYSEQVAQKTLDGDAGAVAELLVRSASANQTYIAVQRISRFDSSLYPSYGFQVGQRVSDKAILVGNILCSSPAWEAGLQAGDEISEVNGAAVKSYSQAEDQLSVWPKMRITLIVQRQGEKHTIQINTLPFVENIGSH